MKVVNPKHLDAVARMINASPYFDLVGVKVTEMKNGEATVYLDMEHKHLNPFGGPHGGVYASMIDTVCYWAAYCEMPEEAGFTSLDLTVNNIKMAKMGTLRADGRVVHTGSSVCVCEATVYDEDENVMAYGTSKLLVLKGKQTIPQALSVMNEDPLPPKYVEQ